MKNRHLPEWRFSLFTRIVKTSPKIWNVSVTGIDVTSFRRVWSQPPPASSQAPYPSLPHKCESSSIPLLVLSKMQTLRWFAFWVLFCPMQTLRWFAFWVLFCQIMLKAPHQRRRIAPKAPPFMGELAPQSGD